MMAAVLDANQALNDLMRDVEAAGNDKLTNTVKKQIAHVLGNNLVFVMNPIGTLHPDLFPDAFRPAPSDILLFSSE